MQPHSSLEISFVGLQVRRRVRVGDVVRGCDADALAGNNHDGVIVVGGETGPRGKGNFYYVMIDTSIFTDLMFN
jgi:hypothetical protein